jgi:surfactin synthase thioesterase subunit
MQLPGREGRFMEVAHTEFRPLIEALAGALVPLLDVPFAFFGHSMGAIIAFELARELRRTLGTQPVHLFVAGARAPHLPDRDIPNRYLSDRDFVARLRHWNGIPPEVLETPELLRIVLPTLRKDVMLCEGYAHRADTPLDCPITVFGGRADEKVRAGELAAWRVHGQGRFTLRFLPGGHFFTVTARAELLAHLRRDLLRLGTGDE